MLGRIEMRENGGYKNIQNIDSIGGRGGRGYGHWVNAKIQD
jgi:hypothetical protein